MGSNNKGFILDLQALMPEKFPFRMKIKGTVYKIVPSLSAKESFYLSGVEFIFIKIARESPEMPEIPEITKTSTPEEIQAVSDTILSASNAAESIFGRIEQEFHNITAILAKCFKTFHPEITGEFLFEILSTDEIKALTGAILTKFRGGDEEEKEAGADEEDFPKGRGRKKGTAPSSPSSRS